MRHALKMGLPTAPVRLVARTPYWKPPLRTLLVTEFIEGTSDLFSALKKSLSLGKSVEPIAANLADLLVRIHRAGIVHNDFSATNVLLDKNENLFVIDLLKMGDAGVDSEKFQRDLCGILTDLQSAGVAKYSLIYFLKRYFSGMGVTPQSQPFLIDQVLDNALAQRRKIARRASRNANRKSRTLERFRYRGFRVFMVKGHSDVSVRSNIDDAHDQLDQPSISHYLVPFWSKEESPLLRTWKMSRALQYSGTGASEIIAFARRYGFKREDVLIYRWPQESSSLMDCFLDPADRRIALVTTGRYLRRLHEMKINLMRLDMSSWRLSADSGAVKALFTKQLDVFTFMETDDIDTRFHWLFSWLPYALRIGLGNRDLAVFLRAYGEGKIDRNLWRLISRAI